MGFGDYIVSPVECMARIPDSMPYDIASPGEPVSVSIDLVETGEVGPGDSVLVIGPGPLGLGAVTAALRAGAASVALAGRSGSTARLEAGRTLGADETIEVDGRPLSDYYAHKSAPHRILVTASPQCLLEAFEIAPFGGVIAYIGIAFGPEARIELDADAFHFKKLSLKASFASPDTQLAKSVRLLETAPELGRELLSHRFRLDEISEAMDLWRGAERSSIKKMVMLS